MSRIKLALDVVNDLRSLAESIETLVYAMEGNDSVQTIEPLIGVNNEPETEVSGELAKETRKRAKAKLAKEAEIAPAKASNETPEESAEIVPEEAAEKQPTLEELRAIMAQKNKDGHREAVKAIIKKYGANNLSAMEPKYYAQAMKEVGDLK